MSRIDFLGSTSKALIDIGENPKDRTFTFFQPFQSPVNAIGRTTSIVTDPLLLEGGALFLVLVSGYKLVKALGHACMLNKEDALSNLSDAGEVIALSLVLLVAGIVSPVLNFVDLLGGIVNSLRNIGAEAAEEPASYSPTN